MRRCIGLDVDREFAEVAIWQDGIVRSAGRIETTPEALRLFAGSLCEQGEVGLNPRVRQSGGQPASHGRITKQGRAHARGMLVEAAWRRPRRPDRCTLSTSVSAAAAGCRSRSSRPLASWPCSAGT